MPLAAGTKLGPYEILSPLGAGGMGEVYRARDPRLARDVAVKVVRLSLDDAASGTPQADKPPNPPPLSPETLRRFEKEARAAGTLNHPNILVVYDAGTQDGSPYLVTELLEGETLRERMQRNAQLTTPRPSSTSPSAGHPAVKTPPDNANNESASSTGSHAPRPYQGLSRRKALDYAIQLANGLAAAHEKGIVHRDLKPENVFLTTEGRVKILDFGLAKLTARVTSEAATIDLTSATQEIVTTKAGQVMGSVGYMPPEQVRGEVADARSDIFSFGAILYEMLSGRRPFHGTSQVETMHAILRDDPPEIDPLQHDIPPGLLRVMERCLEKEPRQRFQSASDLAFALEALSGSKSSSVSPLAASPAPSPRKLLLRRALPWALGTTTLLLTAFAVLAAYLLFQPRPPQPVVRFPVPLPDHAELITGAEMSLSPDGHSLAFIASESGNPSALWVRRFGILEATPLQGTAGAYSPFWSPDSGQIGFYAHGKLETIAVEGGAPKVLCDAHNVGGLGGTWNRQGVILFAAESGLYRVPDTGGTPALVVPPDPARQQIAYASPQFLPDGRHFLVQIHSPGTQPDAVGTGSLDSKTVQRLAQISTQVDYAAGHLFYVNQHTLVARPFSAGALRFTGPAHPVAQNIVEPFPYYAAYSVSPAGVLTYQSGSNSVINAPGQMTWFSRAGNRLGTVGQSGVYWSPALSPTGTKLAVGKGNFNQEGIWVYDLKRGTASRLTFTTGDNITPSWSADGSSIFFSSNRSPGLQQYGIYRKAANGLGNTQLVLPDKGRFKVVDDLSADGRYAIYEDSTITTKAHLWALPLFGDRKPFPYVQGNFTAIAARFSPNGHYVAYMSNETGNWEIYVQTFPRHTGKWEISVTGGELPMWSRDGKELFYLASGTTPSEFKLMAVAVGTTSAALQAGIPKPLFQTQLFPRSYLRNGYVPSPDGKRFLMLTPMEGKATPKPLTVVLNWPTLLAGK